MNMVIDHSPASKSGGSGGRRSHYGAQVEYAVHCLVWLAEPRDKAVSSGDLAALQGVPPAFMAKIMPRMERAGLVISSGGIAGGYRIGRNPEAITVLDIVDAVDGGKSLFNCRDIRRDCLLFDGDAPEWIGRGVCGIHAVFLRAEKAMRAEMARTTLQDLALVFRGKAPPAFGEEVQAWLDYRSSAREQARLDAIRTKADGAKASSKGVRRTARSGRANEASDEAVATVEE